MTGSGSRDQENLPAISIPVTLGVWHQTVLLQSSSGRLLRTLHLMARLENRATGVVSCRLLLSRLFPLLAFWGGDMNYKIIRPRFLEVLVCCITPFKGSPEGMENSLCPWKTKGIWREAAGVGFRPSQLSIQLLRGLYPRVLLAGPKAQRRSCYDLTVKYTPTTPAHVCALDHLVPR